ncbi:MAG: hypothetical protein CMP23_02170 [Rickettsiales bacterium]|nr:hypothetical protein [Rickettsiales bacterium]|tara:strand:- start:388 stop:1155 length:768 start_codon:yes stop_codon:yes gene_type:complete
MVDDESEFLSTGNIQVAPDDGTEDCVRYEVELDVLLRHEEVERPRVVVNVSAEGVFAECMDKLPLGELVQVVASVPGGALRVMATVERVVLSEEAAFVGGVPGIGMRFFLMDEALRDQWGSYLDKVRVSSQELPSDPEAPEHRRDAPIQLSRRDQKEPRRGVRLPLRVRDRDQLLALYTLNVSRGGMFIATSRPSPPGTRIDFAVIHPVTGVEFPLEAEVRWSCAEGEPAELGMGVMLLFPEGGSDDFLAFVHQG